MQVPIVENVLKLNDEVAQMNRRDLLDAGVFSLDLMGAPGCGKTTLLETTLRELGASMNIGVMVGDLTTARDAERMAPHCANVVQINTGKSCHLDANQVRQAMSRFDLAKLELMIIENVGNLICPVGFDLGQTVKVGMFSVTEGDDKAAKHPYIVDESDVLLLSKVDLIEYIPFDLDKFREDVRRLAPRTELIELKSTDADHAGTQRWLEWIRHHVESNKT